MTAISRASTTGPSDSSAEAGASWPRAANCARPNPARAVPAAAFFGFAVLVARVRLTSGFGRSEPNLATNRLLQQAARDRVLWIHFEDLFERRVGVVEQAELDAAAGQASPCTLVGGCELCQFLVGLTRIRTEITAAGEIDRFLFQRCDVHTASYCGSSVPYNPSMTLTERRFGDVTVLDLKGRLVLDEGDTVLRDCLAGLIREARFKIVLNLGDVSYIDSCGIGVLIAKFVSFRRKGGDVRLLHVTPRSCTCSRSANC